MDCRSGASADRLLIIPSKRRRAGSFHTASAHGGITVRHTPLASTLHATEVFTMKAIVHNLAATILAAAMLTLPPCQAQQLPLWEAGAGIAALVLPDYRGAD